MQKIFILLPVHDRCKITAQFITCFKVQPFTGSHLVLMIDDGSTDGTEETVRSKIESLTVIKGRGEWAAGILTKSP